ncbi:MAG: glycosyltransferase family 4 protein [Candidatus Eisenbacteria bacterium]
MNHAFRVALASRRLLKPTGAMAVVIELARGFHRCGWDVDIFGEKLNRSVVLESGAHPHRVFRLPNIKGYRGRVIYARQCEARFRWARYDLVVGHGDLLRQNVLFLHNLIHKTAESIPGKEGRKLDSVGRFHEEMLTHDGFEVCIANSQLMKDDLVTRFGLDEARIHVAHPGFDPDRFHVLHDPEVRRRRRQSLGLEDGQRLIGFVTSGDYTKRGLPVLLRALSLLAPDLRETARLLVVGGEPLGPFLEMAEELGVAGAILYHPRVPDVERLMQVLDVFVHPAYIEEFGLVVQEAMACGIPVVTSKRVGASELMLSGHGVLDAPDPDAFAAELETLLRRPDVHHQRRAEGLTATSGNSWEHYVGRVLDVLMGAGLVPSVAVKP